MVFDTIEYLKQGTERQQQAYQVLTRYHVMEQLKDFEPILVGTVPIQVDIPSSDLDVVCYLAGHQLFVSVLTTCFGQEKNFKIRQSEAQGTTVVVANFELDDFEIEVFGQNTPSKQQLGYRHMVVEHGLIVKHGEAFRQGVVDLKLKGYKTEPAFGKLLNLGDDPYAKLLDYEAEALALFSVRRVQKEDLDAIRTLFYETIHSVNAKDYDKIQIETWSGAAQNIAKWEERLREQCFYVAHFQQQTVGFASLADDGYIDLMYVHKDFQRQGIAKLLLQTLEQKAKEQGQASVWADVSITAVSFFSGAGFEVEKVYAKRVGEVVFENTIMRKGLLR